MSIISPCGICGSNKYSQSAVDSYIHAPFCRFETVYCPICARDFTMPGGLQEYMTHVQEHSKQKHTSIPRYPTSKTAPFIHVFGHSVKEEFVEQYKQENQRLREQVATLQQRLRALE